MTPSLIAACLWALIATLIELAGQTGPEYRVGFTNFYVITRYNRSLMYASAVNDLAEALATAAQPPPFQSITSFAE